MKVFFEAFGGLVGVVVIGLVAVAAMIAGDWLVGRFTGRNDNDESRH